MEWKIFSNLGNCNLMFDILDLVAALEVFARKCIETMERIRSKESLQDIPVMKEQFGRSVNYASLFEVLFFHIS